MVANIFLPDSLYPMPSSWVHGTPWGGAQHSHALNPNLMLSCASDDAFFFDRSGHNCVIYQKIGQIGSIAWGALWWLGPVVMRQGEMHTFASWRALLRCWILRSTSGHHKWFDRSGHNFKGVRDATGFLVFMHASGRWYIQYMWQ